MIQLDNSWQLLCWVLTTTKINGLYKKYWSPEITHSLIFSVNVHVTCANHIKSKCCKWFFFSFFFFRPQYGGKFCQGSSRIYQLCNTQPCPANSLDFRAQQCAEYNSKPFRGWYYKWKPYTKVEGNYATALMDKGHCRKHATSWKLSIFFRQITPWCKQIEIELAYLRYVCFPA